MKCLMWGLFVFLIFSLPLNVASEVDLEFANYLSGFVRGISSFSKFVFEDSYQLQNDDSKELIIPIAEYPLPKVNKMDHNYNKEMMKNRRSFNIEQDSSSGDVQTRLPRCYPGIEVFNVTKPICDNITLTLTQLREYVMDNITHNCTNLMTACICPYDSIYAISSRCNAYRPILCDVELRNEQKCSPKIEGQPYGIPVCMTIKRNSITNLTYSLKCKIQDAPGAVYPLDRNEVPNKEYVDYNTRYLATDGSSFKTLRQYRDSFTYKLNSSEMIISDHNNTPNP
eukprot:NODE_2586_length_1543_cov_44.748592_g2228_i0.p1 GENE.NODE_2586_length_1543_cov_44.748592_g2228_i0~~NODE_2586_length_1543_cov_44.748592_g2228_i0.p1  ORF type:complete len:283 (+),score=21.34 NODE_2586_length_1543_cov_44.748592_g2228_i0:57-905(+)